MFDNESVSYINNSGLDDYSDYNNSNSNRNSFNGKPIKS